MNTSFERKSGKEDWLTPKYIIEALGEFDLDPCCPENMPWKTADIMWTKKDSVLIRDWFGRVWCNPPYGKKTKLFLNKLKHHNNGIALIFVRPETRNWFDNIWYSADAILFIKGRLKFYDINGKQADSAGCASCLVAYGKNNVKALEGCSIKGKIVYLRNSYQTHK